MVLNKKEEEKINKRLFQEAEFNSRNSFGPLSYTQINRIYEGVLKND